MKTTIKSLFALYFLLSGAVVFAQDHVLTYVKKTAQIDTAIDIGGESHTIVRLPVVEMVSGDRFAVIYAAPAEFGLFTTAVVTTLHSSDDLVPNMTIDTFPAQVQVIDGVNYILSSDGLGGYDFVVTGSATVAVSIDLGDTILSLSNSLAAKDPDGVPILTDVNIGASANAYPFGQFGRYTDRTELINALDKWIDYIRIIPQ